MADPGSKRHLMYGDVIGHLVNLLSSGEINVWAVMLLTNDQHILIFST